MTRLDRIDLLLADWDGRHALEPLGFTPDEIARADSLYLFDALADGRVIVDDGNVWRDARAAFLQRWQRGEFERTRGGWRTLKRA